MIAALVLAAALGQVPTFVQLPSGGFVPCDHPLALAAGLGCGQATPTAPTPAPIPAAPPAPTAGPGCDPRPNPYTDAAAAAACAAWDLAHRPHPRLLPIFEVGAVYRDSYDTFRIAVLSIVPSLEGVPVVTAEYVKGPSDPGQVVSFRIDTGVPWQRVP
jgi:hypothetical protein